MAPLHDALTEQIVVQRGVFLASVGEVGIECHEGKGESEDDHEHEKEDLVGVFKNLDEESHQGGDALEATQLARDEQEGEEDAAGGDHLDGSALEGVVTRYLQ